MNRCRRACCAPLPPANSFLDRFLAAVRVLQPPYIALPAYHPGRCRARSLSFFALPAATVFVSGCLRLSQLIACFGSISSAAAVLGLIAILDRAAAPETR